MVGSGWPLWMLLGIHACSSAFAESPAPNHQLDSKLFIELVSLTDGTLSLSPHGKYIAYQSRKANIAANAYQAWWHIKPIDDPLRPAVEVDAGDANLFRASMPDGTIHGGWWAERPMWSADERLLCYRKRLHEATHIWCVDPQGKEEQITRNEADVEEWKWSRNGRKLLFAVDVPRAIRSKRLEEEFDTGHLYDATRPWSALHARRPRARYELSGGQPNVWVFDLARRVERKASAEEALEFAAAAERDIDTSHLGDRVRVISHSHTGAIAWMVAEHPDKQGAIPPLSLYVSHRRPQRDAILCGFAECRDILGTAPNAQLRWSATAGEVYFTRREGPNNGRVVWYAWNPTRSRIRQILDATREGLSDCHFKGDTALCFSQRPSYPRTLVSLDMLTGVITTIADHNPWFSAVAMPPVERIEWSDPRGRSTFGYLVQPFGNTRGKPYPLIICGYRASEVFRGSVGDECPAYVFAAHGFAVLAYDMPEAWDLMARTENAVDVARQTWNGDRFELSATLSALEAALGMLHAKGIVDPERVGIAGLSTAASQINYALVKSQRFRAAIMSQPPWSGSTYFLSTSGSEYRSVLGDLGLGAAGSGKDSLTRELDLAPNASKVSTPLLINASDAEYLPALETMVALAEAGKPIELWVYPDEYHIKWHPRHRWQIYERNLDWFSFWLQDIERQQTDQPDQYVRWRQMRSTSLSRNLAE
jgi:dipeptidyl aminopeptidase/acylaminoacyl peptidase